MAPDASKFRLESISSLFGVQSPTEDDIIVDNGHELGKTHHTVTKSSPEEESLECVLQPRVLADFSYMEEPMKCYLTCHGKRLACNGKSACFMSSQSGTRKRVGKSDGMDEFVLLPQPDGTMVLQNVKTQQNVSSASNGAVYAPKTCHAGLERWIMTPSATKRGRYVFTSFVHPDRRLVCKKGDSDLVETSDSVDDVAEWKVDILSGEVCYLTHPASNDMHMYCDLLGNLSMSKSYQGWAAWRFAEAGDGYVRISPWAHSHYFLTTDNEGNVSVTEKRGASERWKVELAPNGLTGVLLRHWKTRRVLRYNDQLSEFLAIPGEALHMDESCVWDLESLHRQIYYVVTNNGLNRRLEATRKRGISTRGLPGRLFGEEWKIEQLSSSYRHEPKEVVTLYSSNREQYLGSNAAGEVFLMDQADCDGSSEKWVIEERDDGFVILSHATGRVLVSQNNDSDICTVAPGTMVFGGNTRWKLEPKIPRQISKEKVQAVGTAVAIGVAGTVATPFLIGGAIGALGIAHVGIAGEVAIGSIRAVEAINTITQVTMSSSKLMISQSSSLSGSSTDYEREAGDMANHNRPFCAWRSWR